MWEPTLEAPAPLPREAARVMAANRAANTRAAIARQPLRRVQPAADSGGDLLQVRWRWLWGGWRRGEAPCLATTRVAAAGRLGVVRRQRPAQGLGPAQGPVQRAAAAGRIWQEGSQAGLAARSQARRGALLHCGLPCRYPAMPSSPATSTRIAAQPHSSSRCRNHPAPAGHQPGGCAGDASRAAEGAGRGASGGGRRGRRRRRQQQQRG